MWNGEMWTVAVMNMLCFKMWWCEMVVGGRLRCNVMSDVEYGGPRRDVRCCVEHVVCSM